MLNENTEQKLSDIKSNENAISNFNVITKQQIPGKVEAKLNDRDQLIEGIFVCEFCDNIYKNKKSLSHHKRSRHGIGRKNILLMESKTNIESKCAKIDTQIKQLKKKV